jgi:hypothetical protein
MKLHINVYIIFDKKETHRCVQRWVRTVNQATTNYQWPKRVLKSV